MRHASIGRRSLFGLLGGAAAWPIVAQADTHIPLIGYLSSLSARITGRRIVAFGRGLGERGFVVGENVGIETRLAEGHYELLPGLAAELIARRVKLIAALASPAADAAKAATATIPIVFVGAYDPVKAGLVASLNRPGGNITGVTFVAASLSAKRLELLRDLAPRSAAMALLTNPTSPAPMQELSELEETARGFGRRLLVFRATTKSAIDEAFAAMVQQRAGAVLVSSDPFFAERSDQIVALAARHALPAVYYNDEAVAIGGLVSYGASINEAWRLAGVYAGRILRGESPANLPVQQSTKLQLVVNLRTAKSLGLSISDSILLRADEVIE